MRGGEQVGRRGEQEEECEEGNKWGDAGSRRRGGDPDLIAVRRPWGIAAAPFCSPSVKGSVRQGLRPSRAPWSVGFCISTEMQSPMLRGALDGRGIRSTLLL